MLLEHQGLQDLVVVVVLQEHLDLVVQVEQVVHREVQEHLDLVVLQVVQEHLDLVVQVVQVVHLEVQVQVVHREVQENLDLQERLGLVVLQEHLD